MARLFSGALFRARSHHAASPSQPSVHTRPLRLGAVANDQEERQTRFFNKHQAKGSYFSSPSTHALHPWKVNIKRPPLAYKTELAGPPPCRQEAGLLTRRPTYLRAPPSMPTRVNAVRRAGSRPSERSAPPPFISLQYYCTQLPARLHHTPKLPQKYGYAASGRVGAGVDACAQGAAHAVGQHRGVAGD